MTIQQLSVFLAVCDEMNYTRAAARSYMSRQAVRQNIAELEKELGGPLFENCRNRLRLSPKGELLRSKALPLLADYRALQEAMNADIRLERPLRLGISISLVPDYLPRLPNHLDSFAQSYPRLPVEQLTMENDEVIAALLDGLLDACLVMDLGGKRAAVERTVLTRHPCAVILRSSVPLFRKTLLSPSDLAGYTLYLPSLSEEFQPLFDAAGNAVDYEVMPSFYQAFFHIMEGDGLALNRYDPREDPTPSVVRSIPVEGLPPLCSSFLLREGEQSRPLQLLRDWLVGRLREDFKKES